MTPSSATPSTPLVAVRGLEVEYSRRVGGRRLVNRVIDGLDLEVFRGETLGIVGESGSGKSTLAMTLVGLVEPVGGSISFDGQELVGLRRAARRSAQRQIQLVFQNPLLSLSPRRRIGTQVEEPLRVHTDLDAAARQERVDELIRSLDLSLSVKDQFPHELSGGQAQRIVLARALSVKPSLMLFDEPTSALDVSVQAGVLNLLQQLKVEQDLTYVFITHDLGVARHLSDRIAVMRTGEIVELADTETLFAHPTHEYTQSLLASSLTV